jgi:hypothetical protein
MADTSHAAWLQQARAHLRACDPVLARLIDDRPDFDPRAWMTQLLPPLDLYGALATFYLYSAEFRPAAESQAPGDAEEKA